MVRMSHNKFILHKEYDIIYNENVGVHCLKEGKENE